VSLASLPTVTPTLAPSATPVPTPTPLFEPTPDGTPRTVKVPILMYHYISTPPAGADAYRVDLSTSPELFAAHLDRLKAEGYTAISLYQLLAYLTQGAPLPEKPVVLTFDDGYRDNYENAFPLLRERGMPATFFVVTDFIDEQRPLYLSWDMAREMLAAGMSIESHSRNHFTLEGQSDDYLVWQALGSLETLEYELGVRPRFISYPAGDYDERTIDIFHSANYWGGLTTTQGATQSSDRPFEMERIRVRNTTTPDDLIRYLTADW
jgi:peptidoglycan/xylan/chitin deacetylase (PgdA/CDA1 family)